MPLKHHRIWLATGSLTSSLTPTQPPTNPSILHSPTKKTSQENLHNNVFGAYFRNTLISLIDREMTTVWLQLAFGPGGPFETIIYNACDFWHCFRYRLSLRTKRDPASFRLIDIFIQCKSEQNDISKQPHIHWWYL